MKLRILILLIAAVSFFPANAKSITSKDLKGKKDDLMGSVVNSDNKKPLKDVSVTAYSTTKKEKVVITDESGNFSFDELKPGTYKFIFEKTGFRRVTKEKILVKEDESFQLNIEMMLLNDFDLMPSPFHFFDA